MTDPISSRGGLPLQQPRRLSDLHGDAPGLVAGDSRHRAVGLAEEDLLPTKKVGLPECHSITGTPVRFAADSRSRRPRRARVPNDNLVPAEHRSAAADKPLRAAVEDSQRVQRVGVDNTPAVGAEDCSLSRYQRSRPRRRRRECPGLPRSRNSPRLH
jgi:hypothetical protein